MDTWSNAKTFEIRKCVHVSTDVTKVELLAEHLLRRRNRKAIAIQDRVDTMAGHVNTLLIEGTFEELCDELAVYLDGLHSTAGQQTTIQSDIKPLLQSEDKEKVVDILVKASSVLNNAPEKGL